MEKWNAKINVAVALCVCLLQRHVRFRQNKGFTLYEILLSSVILGVAIVPIMQVMPQALSTGAMVERLTKATFLAEKKMEETKNLAIYDFEVDYSVVVAPFAAPDEDFKYTIIDDANAEIKTLAVIAWYDADADDTLDDGENNVRFDTKVVER